MRHVNPSERWPRVSQGMRATVDVKGVEGSSPMDDDLSDGSNAGDAAVNSRPVVVFAYLPDCEEGASSLNDSFVELGYGTSRLLLDEESRLSATLNSMVSRTLVVFCVRTTTDLVDCSRWTTILDARQGDFRWMTATMDGPELGLCVTEIRAQLRVLCEGPDERPTQDMVPPAIVAETLAAYLADFEPSPTPCVSPTSSSTSSPTSISSGPLCLDIGSAPISMPRSPSSGSTGVAAPMAGLFAITVALVAWAGFTRGATTDSYRQRSKNTAPIVAPVLSHHDEVAIVRSIADDSEVVVLGQGPVAAQEAVDDEDYVRRLVVPNFMTDDSGADDVEVSKASEASDVAEGPLGTAIEDGTVRRSGDFLVLIGRRSVDWLAAMNFCRSRGDAGIADWRVPSRSEASELATGDTLPPEVFWTRTRADREGGLAFVSNKRHSGFSKASKDSVAQGICVHRKGMSE